MYKIDFPDVGYTPDNLRRLIEAAGLTQQQGAGAAPAPPAYHTSMVGRP